MVRVDVLADETRPAVIVTPAGDLTVSYRPYALLARDIEHLDAAGGVEAFSFLPGIVRRLIASWDLVGPVVDPTSGETVVSVDEVVPLDESVLRCLSSALLMRLARALVDVRSTP